MKKTKYPELVGEMAKNGDTQMALAKILGITYPSVSRRLSGISKWTISDIEKVCKHYKKSYEELFKRGE